jgi:serine/threonine protein kinase/tetratricopeptide (TPR) repeat protein
MGDQTDRRDEVELLCEEFIERHRSGGKPTPAEYVAAYPEFAESIERLFPTMLSMELLKNKKLSSSGPRLELQVERLEQLGDFRIIREIGRGGMGIVYEAEQQSLARNVAVKVFPRQTLTDPRQLKRFQREARTAASLHHTNIVPIFNVGEQDGYHYYAMQQIHGIVLDQIIGGIALTDCPASNRDHANGETPASAKARSNDTNIVEVATQLLHTVASPPSSEEHPPPRSIANLTSRRSRQHGTYWRGVADIGIQVASALNYAHAKGVFHRDIKPGNLMLDAQGTVWITDFGLAMVVEAERLSHPGDLLGTLRFMAPEHFNGEHDARSDIYSLGLTLYELLALRPAFQELSRPRLVEKVLNGEIPRLRTVRPEIPSDLEAIVLRAISRDPRRRYQTASQLSDDLRCFLEDRPIRARRIGWMGRSQRWMRRNPAIASLTAALLVVLCTSFALISTKWREAVGEYQRADSNLALALDLMDGILAQFASNWMAHPADPQSDAGESRIEVRIVASDSSAAILEDALKFYDQFAQRNATNPRLQLDTAKAHRRVGDIHERLGQHANAEESEVVREHSVTLNQLGLVLYWTSRFEEAKEQFLKAKSILADEQRRRGSRPVCQYELARTHNNLGRVMWLQQHPREAGHNHRQAVELLKGLATQNPTDVDYRLGLARAYRSYYPFAGFGNRDVNPTEIRSNGIAILVGLLRDFPNVPDYQCELSEMLTTTVGSTRWPVDSARIKELRQAVELAQALARDYPTIPRYRAALAGALRAQGTVLAKRNAADADRTYAESIELYQSLASEFPAVRAYQFLLALTLQDRGDALRKSGRLLESRSVLEEAIAQQKIYLSLRPSNHFGYRMLARQYSTLEQTLRDLGDDAAAQRAAQEGSQLREELETRKKQPRIHSAG